MIWHTCYFLFTWSPLSRLTSDGDEEDVDRLHPRGVPEPKGTGGGPPSAGPDHVLSADITAAVMLATETTTQTSWPPGFRALDRKSFQGSAQTRHPDDLWSPVELWFYKPTKIPSFFSCSVLIGCTDNISKSCFPTIKLVSLFSCYQKNKPLVPQGRCQHAAFLSVHWRNNTRHWARR